ncbi:hypothetical protein VP1G_10604 [Cytospora mali]|uniref:Uncharacterized protein n=1 Tax=Cytospora mali TaxID=578113 RepID=A0A194UPB5_CYTMA|nr:hypothetical protein VP1G_10604 [Valsa mali var. pyri (nom. inval.)]
MAPGNWQLYKRASDPGHSPNLLDGAGWRVVSFFELPSSVSCPSPEPFLVRCPENQWDGV